MCTTINYAKKCWILAALLMVLVGCATSPTKPMPPAISIEELERILPKPAPNLALDEIVKLSKNKESAEQIIEKIKLSQSHYNLAPSQSLALSKQGVNAKVLDFIHADWEQVLRNSIAGEINKRQQLSEEQNKREQEMLLREYQMRYRYYDPFDYGYPPYWGGYPYYNRPYIGPHFFPPRPHRR
ncbi:MAG: hypothetical protein ABL885_09675 [Methylophilaceae bacterium]